MPEAFAQTSKFDQSSHHGGDLKALAIAATYILILGIDFGVDEFLKMVETSVSTEMNNRARLSRRQSA